MWKDKTPLPSANKNPTEEIYTAQNSNNLPPEHIRPTMNHRTYPTIHITNTKLLIPPKSTPNITSTSPPTKAHPEKPLSDEEKSTQYNPYLNPPSPPEAILPLDLSISDTSEAYTPMLGDESSKVSSNFSDDITIFMKGEQDFWEPSNPVGPTWTDSPLYLKRTGPTRAQDD